jgi:hypothetical protein
VTKVIVLGVNSSYGLSRPECVSRPAAFMREHDHAAEVLGRFEDVVWLSLRLGGYPTI